MEPGTTECPACGGKLLVEETYSIEMEGEKTLFYDCASCDAVFAHRTQ